jgi:Queuine tRNA-ribosyltransferase
MFPTPPVYSLLVSLHVGEAMQRLVCWLDHCITHYDKSGCQATQDLFAIMQGSIDPALRDECLDEMTKCKDQGPRHGLCRWRPQPRRRGERSGAL